MVPQDAVLLSTGIRKELDRAAGVFPSTVGESERRVTLALSLSPRGGSFDGLFRYDVLVTGFAGGNAAEFMAALSLALEGGQHTLARR